MNRLTAIVCTTIVAAFALRASAASVVYEDVPVPGGSEALARALGIEPTPDRARFMFDLTRLVYDSPEGRRPGADQFLLAVRQAFQRGGRPVLRQAGATDSVPVPLTADIWSDAIFRRKIAKDDLVYSIVADRMATLLCHGLTALDDQTLQYLADHPSILTRIYEKSAPIFAVYSGGLRIHANRVITPGDEAAVGLWETVLAEKTTRVDRFVSQLLENSDGRVAGLFDMMSQLDRPHLKFVLGDWLPNAAVRAERFKALATSGVGTLKEWHVRTLPFGHPSYDLPMTIARVAVRDDGTPLGPNGRGFWLRVFTSSDVSDDAAKALRGAEDEPMDAAWLAETVQSVDVRGRSERLEQLAFGQRVFSAAAPAERPDALLALRGLTRYRMLVVTLDRLGVTSPAVYVAALRHAVRLAAFDGHHGFVAQAQFQGALALVARMRAVRTLDAAKAQALVERLVALPIVDERYAGGVAGWIRSELGKAIAPGETMELAVLAAMSGAASADPKNEFRVTWEGQPYRLDLGASERRRLRQVREKQEALPLDLVLEVAQASRRLAAEGIVVDDVQSVATQLTRLIEDVSPRIGREGEATLPPGVPPPPSPRENLQKAIEDLTRAAKGNDVKRAGRVAEALAQVTDELLARVLLSIAYAADVGDPEGTVLLAGDVSHRHDFGFGAKDPEMRARLVWAMPRQEVSPGVPWRVTGSLLGLDIALAPLALRRVNFDRVLEAPKITSNERESLALSVALINPFQLRDADLGLIAGAMEAGNNRVKAATSSAAVDAIADALAIEPSRRRMLHWTLAHEPEQVVSYLTGIELLVLGGASLPALDRWGMEMVHLAACVCSRLLPPGSLPLLAGRPQLGLIASAMADLHLQVAVMLKELNLPAALARVVLSGAMQDFVDEVRPIDDGDWLALTRRGRMLSRERLEDYIAAATASGPLVPDGTRTNP